MNIKKKLGRTNILLSPISIGTSTFGNMYGKMSINTMKNIVHSSIDNNLNYFDTSPYYGLKSAEKNLGIALKGINRDKFIISTKVGRYGYDEFDFSEKTITKSIDESLKRLKIDYVDILLAHDVEFGNFDQIIDETLPALQKIKDLGKARYIGFSCYPVELFSKIIDNSNVKIDVILSYAHNCIINNRLNTIIPYLNSKNIGIINASPLCMGLLSSNFSPKWHPAPKDIQLYINQFSNELYSNYNIKIEDVALAYVLKNKNIATTLVSIKNMDEFQNIIDILSNKIKISDQISQYVNANLKKYINSEF